MVLTPAKKYLGKIAAVLGILQGLAWICMSLIGIILHYWKPELEIGSTYGEYIGSLIYHKFIVDDMVILEGVFTISGNVFNVFMWLYFVLSVMWCAVSVDQFTAICADKNRQVVVMRIWGGLTLFISLLDQVFTMLLALDYTACGGTTSKMIDDSQYFCYLTVGIVMTIAARGFTLWLVNVIFAITMVVMLGRYIRETASQDSASSVYSTIPRAKIIKNLPHNGSR